MPESIPFSRLARVNPPLTAPMPEPETSVSFIPMSDVSDAGEWEIRRSKRLREIGPGYTPFQEDDVLFAKITPCMENGKGCHARELLNGIGFGSTEFHVLRARDGAVSRFIYHWSRFELLRKKAETAMTGSAGQQRVDARFFDRFLVPCLESNEQSKIAEMLDAVDVLITKTEGVIAKLRHIKSGFLHDLLTYGLDEHGRLRDPRRNPQQFRSSQLGCIPQSWQAITLGEVISKYGGFLQTGPFGSQLHAEDYAAEGVAVVMPRDLSDDGTMDLVSAAKISETRAVPLMRHRLCGGDLLFARRGDLSRCCVVPAGTSAICGTGCLLFRPPSADIHSSWFAALYKSDFCQRQIAARAVGTTMVNLNSQLLTSLWLRLPEPREQELIADHIETFNRRLQTEDRMVRKLRFLRCGLAHDLLMGRVCVKV